jgi:hypothetical protein
MAALTREELLALPEIGIGRVERIIDGKRVWVPFMPEFRAVWFEEDEPPGYVVDGVRWNIVETADGQRGRMRGLNLGEFVPDDPDVETRIVEILRKHDAFDDDLLKALVDLVEAERDDAWESGADDSRYSAERE